MSPAAPRKLNPFPGLRPFTQEEDYLFFGREEQTLELLQRLGSQRFVAVVGSSGSGKSSLVRCGLLSELLGGRMLEAGAAWEIAVTHPGGNPLALLTEALLDADLYDREAEHVGENLLATLSRSHFGLVESVKQAGLGEGTNFLLVVDQFEEIFRFHEAGQRQQEAANEFVSLLLEAVAQKDVPIYVVLTMRSDFIGECGQFEGLAEMVNRGEFLIPRLTREQYKRVIDGPIKVAGGQIAPRLLQRLLNDLGQQADQLPCLQHALMRTWNVWAARGDADALDLDDYQRVGRMSQALSLHADEIYESLASDRQRDLCRGLFQALTVEESNSRGIRRPQRLGRLCQILEVPAEELRPIIDAYRQSGVTFLMPSPEVALTDPTIIDISHESLMRVWTRLRQWVEEETQAAGIYHRLSESADLHQQGKAGLYRDPELGIALAWRESKRPNIAWAERYRPGFPTAMEFLESSRQASVLEEQAREAARQHELEQAQELAEARQLRLEQQQRAAGKLRKLIGGLAVVAVIAGVACVFALIANQRANTFAETARQKEKQANQNATRAEQSQKDTAKALAVVASQKADVLSSLSKAEAAERQARAAEEAGRKLLYTTDMRLAPFVWRDDRTTAEQLRGLLAKHVPANNADGKSDLRGFEWHYYQHLLERSATVFPGSDVPFVSAAFDAQGQPVTFDEDGQVRRWNLSSEDEDRVTRRDIPGGANAQVRVLSPDGKLVALVAGNEVLVFDAATGQPAFQVRSTPIIRNRLVAFSGDGTRMVVADDKVRWCLSATGEVTATLDRNFDRVEGLVLSADGLLLAVVGHSSTGNTVSTYRLNANGRTVAPQAENINLGGTMGSAALSPDGKRLAVGAALSGALFVLDPATGRMLTYLSAAHASRTAAIAFSPDSLRLATADAEGTIKIWNDVPKLNSRSTASLTLKGHQGAISSIAFSSDGRRLITTSADQTARVWDLENAGAAIQRLEVASNSDGVDVDYSPDGQLIAAAIPASSTVRLWDAGTGKVVRDLTPDQPAVVYSVAFSPTDSRLLAVGYAGTSEVILWDIDAGTELARLPGTTDLPGFVSSANNSPVGALAFSPDGKHLVAGFGLKNMLMSTAAPSPLKVWDVASRKLIRRLNGHTGYCVSLDFSPDGTLLASGSRDGTAILWSTRTWKPIHTLTNPDLDSVFEQVGRPGMVEAVAFSPDGEVLAQGSRERSIHLWSTETGTLLDTLKGHSAAVAALVFAPDGRTLASASQDETVRLWNGETRGELMQLDSGNFRLGSVQALAFSPDGRSLLAGGDGPAFWSATPVVWNDPDRAAEVLKTLLETNADFRSRVRMLSENLRLHGALEKLDSSDPRVAAGLAATQANWHASRGQWPEAAAAFDRLVAADPQAPQDWLRTPGLLRLATALLHQDRPREAAALLTGGARRRSAEGLPAIVDRTAIGMIFSVVDTQVVVSQVSPGSPAIKVGLRPGDIIEKVNDTELAAESYASFLKMLEGAAGSKVRLTVRRAGSDAPQVIEVTRERFVNDVATGDVLLPLRAAVNERLEPAPRHPGLLELRAELAGQWSDAEGQIADYTTAIDVLTQDAETAAADLQRLYARRGDAHWSRKQWSQAIDDYARSVSETTTDDELLTRQAQAQAEVLLAASRWSVLKPVEATAEKGTTFAILPDDSVLASGDSPLDESYRIETVVDADMSLTAVRVEALIHDSLPKKGPGRTSVGTFSQRSLKVTATPPDGAAPITLRYKEAWCEQPLRIPIQPDGKWNTSGARNENTSAIWRLESPVALTAGTRVTFETRYGSWQGKGENAGRIRLSLSSDPAAIEHERLFLAASKITDPWQRLAAAYRQRDDSAAIDHLRARHPRHTVQIGDAFTLEGLQDWPRAVDIYSTGITPAAADVSLLSQRARAYEALQNWDAAVADWARAAAESPDGASLLSEFGRRLAVASQLPLAQAQFELALARKEASLQADAENDVVASELADVLVSLNEVQTSGNWTVPQPQEMTSQGGASIEIQPGGSILVSGSLSIDHDTYTVVIPAPENPFTGIRLEVLPHASLPLGGSGRALENGNFALSEFTAAVIPGGGDTEVPLDWAEAVSDHEIPAAQHYGKKHIHIRNVIDGDAATYWEGWPESRVPHRAYFFPKAAVSSAAGDKLKFTLRFGPLARHSLGHFRLAVSDDPVNLERGTRREQETNRSDVTKLTDPWLKLAAAYALAGQQARATQVLSTVLQRAGGYDERKPILEIASRLHGLLAPVVQAQPDDLQLQLALARHHVALGARLQEGQQTQDALAELQSSRDVYARIRAAAPESNWRVARPKAITSPGGEVFAIEDDGSVFVSGTRAHRAVYTLTLPSDLTSVTAIRLETIPDPRLPNGGAGRYGNGNFHLAEFTAAMESSGKLRPLAFRTAIADAATSVRYDAAKIIDRDPRTYWDAFSNQSEQPHTVVFVLKSPARLDGNPLRVILDSGITSWGQHGLGRFRISLTDESEPQNLAALRMDLKAGEMADVHVAMARVYSQRGKLDEAVADVSGALDLVTDRTDRSRILTQAAELAGVLEALAERSARQPSVDQQTQLALAREFSARGQKRLSEALSADAQADLQRALALFGQLRIEPQWSVLTPIESRSTSGETLSVEHDGSLFVRGPNPDRAEYTLKFKTDLPVLTAIRLETLPDHRLPTAGAGRSGNGNFTVAELTGYHAARTEEGSPKRLEFGPAVADYQQGDSGPLSLFDGDLHSHWNTYPQVQQPHRLVAEFKAPVRGSGGVLSLTLDSGTAWPKHGLGRFRISATGDAAAVESERLRNEVPNTDLVNLRLALAKSQALQGRAADAVDALLAALEPAVRDVRIRVITEAAQLEGVLELLAERSADNTLFQAELARHLSKTGDSDRAQAVRLKARSLFERQLQAEPRNAELAAELADLLQTSVPDLEFVWIDDESPAGANLQGDSPWEWVGPTDHPVFRGEKAMRRQAPGRSQHFFDGAPARVTIGHGARLFVYVYLDPQDTPKTLMLQFNDGSWDHRAIWGEDLIDFGTAGTVGHVLMGPLPKAGEWVRLEIDAAKVGLAAGTELTGWAFTQHGGTCYWDAAGWTQTFDSPWQRLFAAYHHLGETERGLSMLANGLDPAEVTAGLPARLLTDELLDRAQTREPQFYAAVLPGSATAALERGELDLARGLYTRLSALQPGNPLWGERAAQLGPDVLGVWNFDAGPGSWGSANRCTLAVQDGVLSVRTTGDDPHFSAPAVGPPGRKGVVLRYRTAQNFTLQVFWADASGGFSDARHHDYAVPASRGEWREITLPFWCEGALTSLRLDPNTDAAHPLEIDTLRLRQLEPAEYRHATTELLIEPELARLTAAIAENGDDAARYGSRGEYLLRIGRWREAAEDLSRQRMMAPKDRILWFKEATARLLAEDAVGHQDLCRAMLAEFAGTTDVEVADSLCKTSHLRPDTLPLSDLPVSVVQGGALEPGGAREWFQGCCALIAYRQGFFEEALGWSKKVDNPKGRSGALALVVRAMAEHQLGQPEARQTLSQAEALIPAELRKLGTVENTGPAPRDAVNPDWLAAELLRREAESLLKGNPRPPR